jgi:hypothetical protein
MKGACERPKRHANAPSSRDARPDDGRQLTELKTERQKMLRVRIWYYCEVVKSFWRRLWGSSAYAEEYYISAVQQIWHEHKCHVQLARDLLKAGVPTSDVVEVFDRAYVAQREATARLKD